jgi:protein-S-isoprenylcysteine O-methyltransferase Ste14
MNFGWLLAILFTVGWVPLYLSRAEALSQALPRYEPIEKLATISTTVWVSLHMTLGCLLLTLESDIPAVRALAAGTVYFVGLGFWFWGRSLIGPLAVRRLPDEPPLEFKRSGAFGIVRHPLYCGYMTLSAAPVVATFNPWLAASYAVCVLLIGIRVLQEEKRLRAQLGPQYEDYSREVKRLIPFVW